MRHDYVRVRRAARSPAESDEVVPKGGKPPTPVQPVSDVTNSINVTAMADKSWLAVG